MSKEQKFFKSAVTGIGIVSEVIYDKNLSFKNWKKHVGNTSVFTDEELELQFKMGRNKIIKFFHIFAFGEGKNINLKALYDLNIWPDNFYLPAYPINDKELVLNLILERWK
ncbi:hypothetical protein [Spiroplasma tabanidicola]|uniref:Uncharacterized protein n=1 Tax=Spiroplasma tabanidicola TaxID=324079 RepID=A0A6I6CBC3_9MOLU|nr:hypothetical protein [Spiroplasma tabanidicola]QGS51478.1 hypothetical protein STABA_v1c01110 [Spiroplasma tabanidicola]